MRHSKNKLSKNKTSKIMLALSLILFLAACIDHEVDDDEHPNWYRDIRVQDWVWSGGDQQDMSKLIDKISRLNDGSNNKFDINVPTYKSGNWQYEWDKLAEKANDQQNYLASSMYYTVAAYPFINENPLSVRSYKQAIHQYKKAVNQAGFGLEKITLNTQDGTAFAYLHTPEIMPREPMPILVVTNGSDHAMTQIFSTYQQYYSKAGFAMISFDLPGLGINGSLTQKADRTNVIHQKVIDYIKSDSRLDKTKIALLAKSFGGNAAVKTAFTNPDDIAAVVSWCGAVNDPFLDLDFTLKVIDPMTKDALLSRFDLSSEGFAAQGKKLALSTKYLGLQKTSVPILSINHANDPVNPLSDMTLVTSSSNKGRIMIIDEQINEGHCSSETETLPKIMTWLSNTI